jgi:N-acetylmuramoyl-L-alanine amidase
MQTRFIVAGLLALATFAAQAADVLGVRTWPAPDHTRIVFDVSSPVEHQIFQLDSPRRLVVDISNTRLLSGSVNKAAASAQIKKIRFGRRNGRDLRVVLDLKTAVKPKSFLLSPSGGYGYRLVVDLRPKAARSVIKRATAKAIMSRGKPVVIAVDPGHGGEDPGASGAAGTREKRVTLAVARKLAKRINSMRGFKAVLTRTGDYYVRLRERIRIARAAKADLLVSIHADAFHDRRVRGSSVWVLSPRGASSEAARWLEARENASDLAGGVSLDDKDDVLASVLLDLSQTATLAESKAVASSMLGELRKLGKVHKRRVERAAFVVLKAPDIPSILVETAFISNPLEERRLRQPRHQNALASALASGIRRYFERRPPPGSLLARQRHVISRGETLSQIAMRYDVSVSSLISTNKLSDASVRSGQVLRIPSGS